MFQSFRVILVAVAAASCIACLGEAAAAAPPSWCQTTTPPAPSKTTTVGPTTFASSISCVPSGYQNPRTLQITNKTIDNVWFASAGTAPSLNSPSNPGNYLPVECTGFYVAPGKSTTLTLPNDLSSARFWPRVGCVEGTEYAAYTPPAGGSTGGTTTYCKYQYLACDTGTCSPAASWQTEYGENLTSSGQPGDWAACYVTTGASPQSLFEVTFGTGGATDYYDLSNVDGFGASLSMNVTGSYSQVSGLSGKFNCNGGNPSTHPPTSPTPAVCLNFAPSTMCPSELQVIDNGSVVGCLSIGAASSSPTQGPILAKAWSTRTDALNADFVTAVKRAQSNGATGPKTLSKVSDLVMPGNTAIYPAAVVVLSCGCGNPATGCGFTTCDAGCSPFARYIAGTCYPWPDGLNATNNQTGSVNCTAADNPQDPVCKASPSSCFVWNSTNQAQNVASQCNSSWWPTPDATFCRSAKSWLNMMPCRYDTIFKAPCPDAYSWQFDDLNSTYQCLNADYTLTVEPTK